MNKRKIGYPKTRVLLNATGHAPSVVLIRDFKLFSHIERFDDGKLIKARHNPLIYLVFLWEKYHNLH